MELSAKHYILNILASPDISEISFQVPPHFTKLKVLRCAPRHDKGILFVLGSSTYNNVRLDNWQSHRHKNHTLLIGHERGVRIRLQGISDLKHWARCRDDYSTSEREQLQDGFKRLAGGSNWDEIKSIVSSILGLAVGTTKFGIALEGAVGGIYAKYTFGRHALEFGTAGGKLKVVGTAAGSAVALGVLAGAAVYFIPWDALFDWLKGAFSWLWDKICKLWERFRSWVVSWFASESSDANQVGPLRPMSFSG